MGRLSCCGAMSGNLQSRCKNVYWRRGEGMGETTSEGSANTRVRGAQEKGRGRAWPGVNAFRCWGHEGALVSVQ